MSRRKGFTLIELLVVISIIAILSSIVLASVSEARDRSRIAADQEFADSSYHAIGDQVVGMWKFDEGSGTIAGDTSGNKNNGTLVNMSSPATATSGWSSNTPDGNGHSLAFDGTNDYVQIPNSSSLNPASTVSFGAWFETNNPTADQKIISKTESGGYDIVIDENLAPCTLGAICAAINIANAYYYVNYPVSLTAGKWYYVFVAYDGKNINLYFDGKLVGTTVTPGGALTYTYPNDLCIGEEASQTVCNAGEYFSGNIDNVSVYAEGLVASQVGELYAETAPYYKNLAENAQ